MSGPEGDGRFSIIRGEVMGLAGDVVVMVCLEGMDMEAEAGAGAGVDVAIEAGRDRARMDSRRNKAASL